MQPEQLEKPWGDSIEIMAVAGGTYEFWWAGVKHVLGPIRLGSNWYQLDGSEVNVKGVTDAEFDDD